jgi:putative toxin-antitoxin system antitoxin component (TIGR02293 family)
MPATGKIPVVKIARLSERSLILVEQIRKGIPSRVYTDVAKRLGLTKTELATKLRISPRTVLDRNRKRLSAQESEKMLRVGQIFDEAEEVFGSAEEAKTWINSGQRGLGGRKPLELLDTDVGAGTVRDLLSAIKYGNVW